MNWYYADGQRQVGPLTEADVQRLAQAGTIKADTLVWCDGMKEWQTYASVAIGAEASPAAVPTASFPSPSGAVPAGRPFDLRPMNIGDILDRTFRLYREHFLTFFLIMLVVQAIAYLAGLAWQLAFVSPRHGGGVQLALGPGFFVGLIPVYAISFVLNQIAIGTLTVAVSGSFLGQEIGIGKAFNAVRSKLGRLLGATILNTLLVGLGMLLCIVPGIYLLLSFLLTSEVVVLEGLGPRAALRRSRELMRVKTDKGFAHHNITKASVILLITFIISMVVGMIVGIPFGIAAAMSGQLQQMQSMTSPLHILQGVITVVVQAAAMPIGTIAMILFYYDIRIRKEGFDLEVLASSLSAPAAAANTAS